MNFPRAPFHIMMLEWKWVTKKINPSRYFMACLWHAVCFQDKHFSDKALAVRSALNLCCWPNFHKG